MSRACLSAKNRIRPGAVPSISLEVIRGRRPSRQHPPRGRTTAAQGRIPVAMCNHGGLSSVAPLPVRPIRRVPQARVCAAVVQESASLDCMTAAYVRTDLAISAHSVNAARLAWICLWLLPYYYRE